MAAVVMPCASAARHVVLVGSPRRHGRSESLSRMLASRLAEGDPRHEVWLLRVADLCIHGCIGCNACCATGECAFADDMSGVLEALEGADELHVVSPVYFAGPPSQLKALLDRLQPHYWRGTRRQPKRPAHLHAVGEGGDPHGFGPLVAICRSSLAVAGFSLETVTAHIADSSPMVVADEAEARQVAGGFPAGEEAYYG